MTETRLQKKILDFLLSIGAWTVKVQSANKTGVPDILCCYRGLFIAIELKRPSRKAEGSALQEYQIRKIKEAGGRAFVANNLATVEQFFKELSV